MDIWIIFNQVATLFIILIIGFIASKVGIIPENVNKKLSEILLYITSPLLIFSSFITEYESNKLVNAGYVILLAIIMFGISISLAEKVLFRRQDDKVKPVFNVIFLTYGVFNFKVKRDIKTVKKALISPAIIAVYIGLIVFVFRIPVPFPIQNAAEMVGNMTTPVAMIIIGAIISQANLKEALSGFQTYYASFIRLVIMPLIALLIIKIIPFPFDAERIIYVVLSMPAAVNVAVFAEQYEANALLGSKIVTVSTLLSIITIPFVLALL